MPVNNILIIILNYNTLCGIKPSVNLILIDLCVRSLDFLSNVWSLGFVNGKSVEKTLPYTWVLPNSTFVIWSGGGSDRSSQLVNPAKLNKKCVDSDCWVS